jgi:hypothetical protein
MVSSKFYKAKFLIKLGCYRSWWSPPPTSASAASFSLVTGSAPVAAALHQVFGSTSAGEESLDWRRLEDKRLGERLGAPTILFMGMVKRSSPQIVVHIPRNLEGGETSLTESPSDRLEFKLSHIRLTGSVELRSDCCSGLVLFDQSCRMDRLKLLSRKDTRKNLRWESKK